MDRERPGGEGGMGVHMPNRPHAAPGIPKGRVAPVNGRTCPTVIDRPGGYGTNAMTPATCGIGGLSHPSAVLVHNDPDVTRTLPNRQRAASLGGQIPTPAKRLERHYRIAVDHSSGEA